MQGCNPARRSDPELASAKKDTCQCRIQSDRACISLAFDSARVSTTIIISCSDGLTCNLPLRDCLRDPGCFRWSTRITRPFCPSESCSRRFEYRRRFFFRRISTRSFKKIVQCIIRSIPQSHESAVSSVGLENDSLQVGEVVDVKGRHALGNVVLVLFNHFLARFFVVGKAQQCPRKCSSCVGVESENHAHQMPGNNLA